MIKIFGLFLIAVNLWAIPPCEHEQQKVCMYIYKGAMSAEMNVINMSQKKVIVDVIVSLDGTTKSFKDWTVLPNQTITLLKSKYKDHLQKPSYSWNNFNYRYID